jgi:proteasome lid subunit RPN8/RPN11
MDSSGAQNNTSNAAYPPPPNGRDIYGLLSGDNPPPAGYAPADTPWGAAPTPGTTPPPPAPITPAEGMVGWGLPATPGQPAPEMLPGVPQVPPGYPTPAMTVATGYAPPPGQTLPVAPAAPPSSGYPPPNYTPQHGHVPPAAPVPPQNAAPQQYAQPMAVSAAVPPQGYPAPYPLGSPGAGYSVGYGGAAAIPPIAPSNGFSVQSTEDRTENRVNRAKLPLNQKNFVIRFAESAYQQLLQQGFEAGPLHVRPRDRRETGGILVGKYETETEGGVIVHVVDVDGCIPMQDGTLAEFSITQQGFATANALMRQQWKDQSLVGIYHTHPGHGVFHSEPDKQALGRRGGILTEPYQFSLVMDHVTRTRSRPNGEIGIFLDNQEIGRFNLEAPFPEMFGASPEPEQHHADSQGKIPMQSFGAGSAGTGSNPASQTEHGDARKWVAFLNNFGVYALKIFMIFSVVMLWILFPPFILLPFFSEMMLPKFLFQKQQEQWVNWDNKGQSIIQDVIIILSFALCFLWWVFGIVPAIEWVQTRTPYIRIIGSPIVEESKVTFNCEFNRIPHDKNTNYLLVDFAVPKGQEPKRYEIALHDSESKEAPEQKQFVVERKFDDEQHCFAIRVTNGGFVKTSNTVEVFTHNPPGAPKFEGAMMGIKMPVNDEKPVSVTLKFGWHPPSANVNKVHVYRWKAEKHEQGSLDDIEKLDKTNPYQTDSGEHVTFEDRFADYQMPCFVRYGVQFENKKEARGPITYTQVRLVNGKGKNGFQIVPTKKN